MHPLATIAWLAFGAVLAWLLFAWWLYETNVWQRHSAPLYRPHPMSWRKVEMTRSNRRQGRCIGG